MAVPRLTLGRLLKMTTPKTEKKASFKPAAKKPKKKTIRKGSISSGRGFLTCDTLANLQLRIEEKTTEKVISNNGYELVTDKACYGIYQGAVNRREVI